MMSVYTKNINGFHKIWRTWRGPFETEIKSKFCSQYLLSFTTFIFYMNFCLQSNKWGQSFPSHLKYNPVCLMTYMALCYLFKFSSWDSLLYWLLPPNQLPWWFLKLTRYISVSGPLSFSFLCLKWFPVRFVKLLPSPLKWYIVQKAFLDQFLTPITLFTVWLFFKIHITI